jgi:hypothetical protein
MSPASGHRKRRIRTQMKAMNSKKLRQFLKLAGEKLTGHWVLMGGAVLPALNVDYRVTTDIDIVGLNNPSQTDTLKLMDLAAELDLPIESINQAGAYFLFKISNYSNHLILLHSGKNATLFRPDIFLYFQLKITRLTETDLSDCIRFLEVITQSNEAWDRHALEKIINHEIKKTTSEQKLNRLNELLQVVLDDSR